MERALESNYGRESIVHPGEVQRMSQFTDPRTGALKQLRSTARIAVDDGNLEKAEELLCLAYQQAEEIFGPSHGEVGIVLLQLVEVCEQLGKTHRANELRRKTDHIWQLYKMDAKCQTECASEI